MTRSPTSTLDPGQIAAVNALVKTTAKSLTAYKLAIGRFPTTDEGLNALLKSIADQSVKWKGPYLKEVPLDPWDQPYVYRLPGTHNPSSYDLFSKGPDGIADTADDIGNW